MGRVELGVELNWIVKERMSKRKMWVCTYICCFLNGICCLTFSIFVVIEYEQFAITCREMSVQRQIRYHIWHGIFILAKQWAECINSSFAHSYRHRHTHTTHHTASELRTNWIQTRSFNVGIEIDVCSACWFCLVVPMAKRIHRETNSKVTRSVHLFGTKRNENNNAARANSSYHIVYVVNE